MLKKSITYENPFTETEVTEEHYFHISKADLVEMEMEEHSASYSSKDGKELTGMQAKLQKIIDSEDGKAIMTELKDLIRRSYGRKLGDRFVKLDEYWDEFASSEAFSQLLFELCTDAEAAAQFMNGVVPNNLAQETEKIAAQSVVISEAETPVPVPQDAPAEAPGLSPERQAEIDNATPETPVKITQAELVLMNDLNRVKLGLGSGALQL